MVDTGHWTRSTLALLETTPDAVVVVDSAGTIVYANRLVEKLFGYSPHSLLGRPVEILIPEEARGRHHGHRADYGRAASMRAMGSGSDLLGLHRSGREFPVDISLSPIELDEGRLFIAAVRDMTERRQHRRGPAPSQREARTRARHGREDPEVAPAGSPGQDPGHRRGVALRTVREARRRQLQRVRGRRRPDRLLHARRDRSRNGRGTAVGRLDACPRLRLDGAGTHLSRAAPQVAEALDDYLEAAELDEAKAALFQTVDPTGQRLTDGAGAVAASRPGDDQAAGCGGGSAGVDLLPHVPGDRDHGVLVERGDARARAADRGARVAEDDQALRSDGRCDQRRRDRAHRDLVSWP